MAWALGTPRRFASRRGGVAGLRGALTPRLLSPNAGREDDPGVLVTGWVGQAVCRPPPRCSGGTACRRTPAGWQETGRG